jgi:fatty acid desaturase
MAQRRIDWYRTPIDKGLLKELTRRSDARGLLQCVSFAAIFAVTTYLACLFFIRQMWGWMVVAAYVHCIFHSFVGMEAAVHELSHGTPFRTRWINEVFYRLFCFLTWNNPHHFRISHMLHHQYTVHRGLDKEQVLDPIPFTVWEYASWFLFDYKKFKMIMFPNIAHFFGNADADFFFWDPLLPPGDPRRRKIVRWARIMVIGHLALLALFIYYQLWILIPVVTFGYFFATFLGRGTGIQQHSGLRSNVPDWRVSCHTVEFGPLTAYLYWNMNYHIEHHSYAAVPFFNLRRLHRAVRSDLPVSVKGYWRGIGRILAIQRMQNKDPSYRYMPEFPPSAAPPRLRAQAAS